MGYLAHEKQPPPRTLQQKYADGPMVVLGRSAISYEQGTPLTLWRNDPSPWNVTIGQRNSGIEERHPHRPSCESILRAAGPRTPGAGRSPLSLPLGQGKI